MTTARDRAALPALLIALVAAWPSTARAGLPKVPDDLEVRLVANVPAFLYACQVATAPDGALYVAVDPMDQVGPYEANLGKIYAYREGQDPVLFAEGFRAIFGMAWHDGALYVSHMPYLSVVRDSDGDGKADSRRDLFKDLGITNNRGLNDHIVSGIQFGIDNRLYISTGDKGVYRATGPDGRTAQLVGGGTLRCKPDGTEIEVHSTGTRNHLEPNLDDRDNLFTYDNTDDGDGWWTRVTHHVDGGYHGYPYDYHDHPSRFLDRIAEYGGGSPCGGVVYKEDAWPLKYRGRAIWAEWGKKQLDAFAFEPAGASFIVKDRMELASPGDSGEFHPLDVALSYDGRTLYVADWGMGSWGSKTEKVGRVFAITAKGPATPTRPRGTDSDPIEAQFRQLDHPSYNERMRAQSAIIKAGRPAMDSALAMLVDARAAPLAKRHLVWVVDALSSGTPDALAILPALRDPSDDVRAQAVRALGLRREKDAAGAIAGAIGDKSPAVRLQAIIALGRIGDPRSVPGLVPILADPDRYLAFSSRQAIRRIGDWPAVARALAKAVEPRLRAAILEASELVDDRGAVDLLRRVAADPGAVDPERALALAELASVARKAPEWDGQWWGTRPTQGKPPSRSIAWEATADIFKAIEAGLVDPSAAVRLASVSAVRMADDRDALPALRSRFAAERAPEVRREIALALGNMGDKAALPLLIGALRDPSTPDPIRAAALTGLEAIGGKPAVDALIEALANRRGNLRDETQIRMISALGRFRAKEAIPAIADRLFHTNPEVRVAAARAIGQVGDPRLGPLRVRPALKDQSAEVRNAAIGALGALGDRDSIPAMLALAEEEPTRFEAGLALARLPDLRALQVYLRGLVERSQEVRKASSTALSAIRDRAAPVLDQLAARRELAPATIPELRKIYERPAPVGGWQVVGTFPLDAPPPGPTDRPVDLGATVAGPDGPPLAWKPAAASGEEGRVDLARAFGGKGNCSAFASAVLESPVARRAEVVVGSDDTLTVWLNGRQVYDFGGNRSYEPESARFGVDLVAGRNLLMVRCGNGGGPWEFSVAVTGVSDLAFLKGPSPGGFDADRFRAVALQGKGRPDRGKVLFSDLKGLACSKCHVVAGVGGAIGPELSGIGARYPREELITSILQPSARIFSGYETAVVATVDGRVLSGLVKSDNADGLELQDADGKRTRIPRADVEARKTSELSLMPSGIVEGIGPDDFADLVAYLETLKDASANQAKP